MMHAINLNPLCTAVRIPGLWAISKHILPGCDRSSKKLWVTQLLLQDAPLNCKTAMPAKWNKYFLENNRPLKIFFLLLIHDWWWMGFPHYEMYL